MRHVLRVTITLVLAACGGGPPPGDGPSRDAPGDRDAVVAAR
jgi:hypothetical protein